MKVLDVGSGAERIHVPKGWTVTRFDADARAKPDIVGDVRELSKHVTAGSYDVIHASHVIEHVYDHEVLPMLESFRRVAREYVHIKCPDIGRVAEVVADGRPIDWPLYNSPAGPVSSHDLLYGYVRYIKDVSDLYAHKCGFTKAKLFHLLKQAGFKEVDVRQNIGVFELEAIATTRTSDYRQLKSVQMKN